MRLNNSWVVVLVLVLGGCTAAEGRPPDALSLAAQTGGLEVEPTSDSWQGEPPDASPIVGGTPVPECGWPSTVAVISETNLCTGTLLYPQLVGYAAHCDDDIV